MDMAERPIIEPHAGQIGEAAGGIDIMARRTAKRAVQHGNIHHARNRRFEPRQKAVGRVTVREADTVDHDVVCQRHHAAACIESVNLGRQIKRSGDRVLGIMIAFDVENFDPGIAKAIKLGHQEGARSCAALFSIEQIAGNQDCGELFGDGEIDQSAESGPGGCCNRVAKVRVAQGQ